MPVLALRQMTPVVAPRSRGGKIHITGLNSPGLTACRVNCDGWSVAPIAGSTADAAIRAAVSCKRCEAAMIRAVKLARGAQESR